MCKLCYTCWNEPKPHIDILCNNHSTSVRMRIVWHITVFHGHHSTLVVMSVTMMPHLSLNGTVICDHHAAFGGMSLERHGFILCGQHSMLI